MTSTVVIDYLAESLRQYRTGYAVVAIDVIRASTTATTAVSLGRRCYPVGSVEAALPLAARLNEPLLVGELGGNMPFGFDLTNSPFEIAARKDVWRPMILLSSSGTGLIANAIGADAVYVTCLRNVTATIKYLRERHQRVAVIGAGTRGEFREEDQYCCALIAAGLIDAGFRGETRQTVDLVERWAGEPFDSWLSSRSVDYLSRTNQKRDLDFILAHRDDIPSAFAYRHEEVTELPVPGEVPSVIRRTATGE